MKVEPELPDHPKFIRLKAQVGAEAMEYVLRLWGHCEANKRGEFWRGATPDYVEAVCKWKKAGGVLYRAFLTLEWLHETDGGIRVHDWEKTNWRRVTNWELGCRPKGKAPPKDPATGKPRLRHGSSPLNEVSDMNEVSECGAPSPGQFPEVEVPSEADVLAWAVTAGVDPAWASAKWLVTQGTHGWERNGRLIDWRFLWGRWFEEAVRNGEWAKEKNSAEVPPPATKESPITTDVLRGALT